MGIQLAKVRIKNFRSLESIEIDLTDNNIIIGQNNCGKSNFLRAVNIGLSSNYSVSDKDIYVSYGESLSKDKTSIIDVMLRPTKDDRTFDMEFSEFWTSVFTDKWITTDDTSGAFVGIRTTIEYNLKFDQYSLSKKQITQWNDSLEDAVCGRKQGFTVDMQSYMACFYMDAHRDILEDLRNKKSYFGRATSSRDMPAALIHDIESQLNDINLMLVENTPALKDAQDMIARIGRVLGNYQSNLTIEPISRSLNDLNRGMDVKYAEGSGPSLSVAEQGMGTRSWISFLTLGAYITYLKKSIKEDDTDAELFVVLALEEPEAHLHSYAQKKLFSQIESFPGQKIISTHSSNIVAQTSVLNLIHLYKSSGKTIATRINKEEYTPEEIKKIHREFVHSKGDLLFSTAIVLAEGITEELALPVYYKQYFGVDSNSAGVAILGIGGQNYKTYLHLLKDFCIPWLIFSDGEESTKRTVKKAVVDIYGKDTSELGNVIVIDNGDDYEEHLIHSGYVQYMIDAINKYEKEERDIIDPEGAKADSRNYFERYIEKNNNLQSGQTKTGERCKECGQEIKKPSFNIYDGEDGRKEALLDCCQKNGGKAKYAYVIAEEIVNSASDEAKIPPKIKALFTELEKILKEGDSGEA